MYRSILVSLMCFAVTSELAQARNLNYLEQEEESDPRNLAAQVGTRTLGAWGKPGDDNGGAASNLDWSKKPDAGKKSAPKQPVKKVTTNINVHGDAHPNAAWSNGGTKPMPWSELKKQIIAAPPGKI